MMSYPLELLSYFEEFLQNCQKNKTVWFLVFDMKSFVKLCKETDEVESKPLLQKTNTLIPLPEEGGGLDVQLFRHTSWFAHIAKEAGEDKALLRFNVEKRLEQYFWLPKDPDDLYGLKLSDFTGAWLIAIKYVVGRERDIPAAEAYLKHYDESHFEAWPTPVEEEMFYEEGIKKFNLLFTVLISVTDPRSVFRNIRSLLIGVPPVIENIQIMDFYNYKKSFADAVKYEHKL